MNKLLKAFLFAIITIFLTAATVNAITLWYLDGTTLKPVDNTWTVEGMTEGDVLSVGDCASGACLDGTSDGGSYIRIYDGDSNYAELNLGNVGSDYTVYLPLTTGTLIHTEADPLSATKALGNLTGVAINTSLISDAADTDDLGSATYEWRSLYLGDDGRLYFGIGQDGSIHRNAANELTITATAGVTVSNDFTATTLYGDGSNLTNVGSAVANALTIDAKEEGTGSIVKGQPVYNSGSAGVAKPLIGLADCNVDGKAHMIGLAAEAISMNGNGIVRVVGLLSGVDTLGTNVVNPDGQTWSAGDELFLSETTGGLTNVRPTSGHIVEIGWSLFGSSNTDAILVEVDTPSHGVHVASGDDITLRMGDSGGSNYVYFKDYANATVGSMDSNGNFTSYGYIHLSANENGFLGPTNDDGDYMTFQARDSDTDSLVIIGGMYGAANPYFGLGGLSEFKFYREGHALAGLDERFQFGDTGVYVFSDDDGYLDLTADTGIRLNGSVVGNGSITATTLLATGASSLTLGSASSTDAGIIFHNATNDNILTIQSGATSGTYTLTLPLAVAGAGEVLTDAGGDGTLSWAAAGAGDVTSVGDCADGACFDGSSDGGTYFDFYNIDSNWTRLIAADVANDITITMPNATGTLAMTNVATLSSLTSIGTIATGVWEGTDVGVEYGGTGASTLTGIVLGNGSAALTATTTSSGIMETISDETGTGALVFGTSPTITTSIDLPAGAINTATEIAADIITHAQIADADQMDSKCLYFEDPTADDDFISIWRNGTGNSFLITEIWGESDQTVNFDLVEGAGDCGEPVAPAAGEDENLGLSCTISAGEEIDLKVNSVTNTPTWVSICFTGNWVD